MTIALLDMDLVCFRSAASAENETHHIARYRMEELLANILDKTEASEYKGYLSSPISFRKELNPLYKANRTQPKPKHLEVCRQHALDFMETVVSPKGLEADDMLAISQTDETIICSLDKDLLQTPGRHFQWAIQGESKGTKWSKPDTFYDISELEGWYRFFTQCLTGDKTDNVTGVVGIGKAKASALLSSCLSEKEMFDVVRSAYSDDEEFIKNGSMLYILRSETDKFTDRWKEWINED